MVWSKVEPATGRKKYIKKFGNNVLLTNSKKDVEDSIPNGWDVITDKNGILRVRREN